MPGDGRCAAPRGPFSLGMVGSQAFGLELINLAVDTLAEFSHFKEFETPEANNPNN